MGKDRKSGGFKRGGGLGKGRGGIACLEFSVLNFIRTSWGV